MSDKAIRSEALAAATERRIELKEAVSSVERAAASPSAKPTWRQDLVRELYILRVALDQHVDEVEGPDGLFAELTQEAPRLVHKIEMVRDEHPGLVREVAEAINLAQSSDDVETTRKTVLAALISIVGHRQRGADLVYEGYNVDIGGGG